MIPYMNDSIAPSPDETPLSSNVTSGSKAKKPAWLVRTIAGVVIAAVLVIAYFIASATVPVTWANTVSNQVAGKPSASIPLGMFYGFMFSFIPVIVAWQAHYKKLNKWVRISILVVAFLLTIPNLLTLVVLNATTNAAARARINWAVNAEWFGTWSVWFMIVGVICGVAVIILSRIWMRRGKKIREVKAAEKIVRENEAVKAQAAKADERAAEKQAREDARTAEKAAKQSERASRRSSSGDTPTDTTPPQV